MSTATTEPTTKESETKAIAQEIMECLAAAKDSEVHIFKVDMSDDCETNEKGECCCEMKEADLEEVCSIIHEKIGDHFNDMLTTSLAVMLAKRFELVDAEEFKEYGEATVAYSKCLIKLSSKCEEKMPKNSKSE